MKRVIRWQTEDGALFETQEKALKHADSIYGDMLTRLAHQMVQQCDKYSKMTKFIDDNLTVFVELKRLKDDAKLEKDDSDDDCPIFGR